MSFSYTDFAKLPASEKVVLSTIESRTQFKIFTLSSGSIYYKDVPYFVSGMKQGSVDLTKADTSVLNSGEYFFDAREKRIYVRMIDDSNPKTKTVICTYKMFFASQPYILPFDLDSGEPVEWDNRIDSIGNLGQQLDDENTGIVLESSSKISLFNNDRFFDSIFDTLIWENQTIEFFSWSPKIPITQAVKLFSGVIESKNFDADKIVFNVKDFVFRLKNQIKLELFTSDDGNVSPDILGTPKRRIYGKMKQVKCVGVDNVLSGYLGTGTISVSAGTAALTGTGTSFLDQLSPSDDIFVTIDDGTEVKLGVDTVTDNTNIVLGDETEVSFVNKPFIVRPKIPWRKKNRSWHLCGHKLIEPITTIISAVTSRRFFVDSIQDFEAGDSITLNSEDLTIKRISGKNIVTDSSASSIPTPGTSITKNPVQTVYFGSQKTIIDRDWSVSNGDDDCLIVFDDLTEFNLAQPKSVGFNLVFTNGTRTITTTANVDLGTLIKPRDWIRKNSITDLDWYEVLDVRGQTITIRTAFAGTTQTTSAKMKNVDLIKDDSLITVDCIGRRYFIDGADYEYKWARTPAEVVKDILLNDAGFTELDEVAFAQAISDCNYTVSMVIPKNIGDPAPLAKDVLTDINNSVFGSIYGNRVQQIAFTCLNARKPESLEVIQDHDILSWDSVTEQKIVNKVRINYRPYTDYFSENDATETLEYESDFVDQFVGIKNIDERTIYLYDTADATVIAQRISFYKSLSNCKITMKGKLNLALLTVNDKMYLEFDRLFSRYGGLDNKKIGIVTGVKKNGYDTEVEMTDLGNIFNRIPSIAPTGLDSYSSGNRDDAVKYGFILDNDTLTPDNTSEVDLGNNRIG